MSRTRDIKESAWSGVNVGICCGVALVVITVIFAVVAFLTGLILPP